MTRSSNGSKTVVFTDADNTLWDTDAVYSSAQLNMLTAVEKSTDLTGPKFKRLEFVRNFDQELALQHHKGLRYPPALLAQAVALGLKNIPPPEAARSSSLATHGSQILSTSELDIIQSSFLDNLDAKPALRSGVKTGLKKLAAHGCEVSVITEGSKTKCQSLLQFYCIEDGISGIIESPKHGDLYRRILKLAGSVYLAVMIGDQLDRDIFPAKEAGFRTIHYPGGFKPMWMPDLNDVRPDYTASSFDDATEKVLAWIRDARHSTDELEEA